MTNFISIVFVLAIQLTTAVILFLIRPNADEQGRSKKTFPLRFTVAILGGALSLALLGANISERDDLAVLLLLVGLGYFILIEKA